MPASDIGIDIGTRNSLVYSTGKGNRPLGAFRCGI